MVACTVSFFALWRGSANLPRASDDNFTAFEASSQSALSSIREKLHPRYILLHPSPPVFSETEPSLDWILFRPLELFYLPYLEVTVLPSPRLTVLPPPRLTLLHHPELI